MTITDFISSVVKVEFGFELSSAATELVPLVMVAGAGGSIVNTGIFSCMSAGIVFGVSVGTVFGETSDTDLATAESRRCAGVLDWTGVKVSVSCLLNSALPQSWVLAGGLVVDFHGR